LRRSTRAPLPADAITPAAIEDNAHAASPSNANASDDAGKIPRHDEQAGRPEAGSSGARVSME